MVRLEVAMHESLRVCVRQPFEALLENGRGFHLDLALEFLPRAGAGRHARQRSAAFTPLSKAPGINSCRMGS